MEYYGEPLGECAEDRQRDRGRSERERRIQQEHHADDADAHDKEGVSGMRGGWQGHKNLPAVDRQTGGGEAGDGSFSEPGVPRPPLPVSQHIYRKTEALKTGDR